MITHPGSERGMALVAVIMMMFIMSGLAASLTMSSRTELAMSTNNGAYAGTRAAAEAGLNHGVAVVLGAIAGSSTSSFLRGPDGAMNAANPSAAVNADNGQLTGLIGGPSPWRVTPEIPVYTYDLMVVDDDDPSLFETPPSGGTLATMGEDGSGFTDANGRLVIRATGFGPRGTRVTLTTLVLPMALPAMTVNGDLRITGSPSFIGTSGSVHANEDLTISGTKTVVAKNATASDLYSVPKNWKPGGTGTGSAPRLEPPDIVASKYLAEADLVLTSTGLIVNRATNATVCNASSNKSACKNTHGWTFTSAAGGWSMNNSKGTEATYFVQGPVTLSGSPGSAATPFRLSIIATGSITVTGSPQIAPEAASGLLFVTDGDLRLGGKVTQSQSVEGRILVREQMSITGSSALNAQIVVQNVKSISNVVTANLISGSPTITCNGLLPSLTYTTSGWSEAP